MIAMATSGESPAQTYARLLRTLHVLGAEGKSDSEEADAVRDQMDAPWYQLTEKEQARLRGLSEDLHALAEGGPKPVAMSPTERQKWGERFNTARGAGDWDQILEMCRHPSSDVPPDTVAFMQARCWANLGEVDVALLFLREGERLNPEMGVNVLAYLRQLGRMADAIPYAGHVLDRPQAGSHELYLAAATLLATVQSSNAIEAQLTLKRVVAALRRALTLERATPRRQRVLPQTEDSVVCTLGLSYEHLGQHDAALRLYEDALARNPGNAVILTFRGIAQYEEDRAAALEDFEGAIREGAPSVWPYFFLARAAMDGNDYTRSLSLSQIAVRKTSRPSILAILHEWIGISQLMLAYPEKYVRESFNRALQLDPVEERIRHNRAVAEEFLAAPQRGRPSSWSLSQEKNVEKAEQDLLEDQQSAMSASASRKWEVFAA